MVYFKQGDKTVLEVTRRDVTKQGIASGCLAFLLVLPGLGIYKYFFPDRLAASSDAGQLWGMVLLCVSTVMMILGFVIASLLIKREDVIVQLEPLKGRRVICARTRILDRSNNLGYSIYAPGGAFPFKIHHSDLQAVKTTFEEAGVEVDIR